MEGKFFYLPQAENNLPGDTPPEPQPPEPEGKYPCPCCGCITYPVPREEALAYICPVCFWENDLFLSREDEPSDENHGLTLAQAQANYKTLGACRRELLAYARPPRPEELPAEGKTIL